MMNRDKKPEQEGTRSNSYYLSLTKLWIPSFPAAILSETATMTAGKPVKRKKSFYDQNLILGSFSITD